MPPKPLVLSPALPSELLTFIIQHETHPTTLIICATRTDFLSSLASEIHHPPSEAAEQQPQQPDTTNVLLAAPLYQVAVARHIRMAFVPTVSHLRAYLSVFSPADSKIPPPPAGTHEDDPHDDKQQRKRRRRRPMLVVYGFLDLHRDTSEWSAQGIGATATTLLEAARRCGFRAVVVDAPRGRLGRDAEGADEEDVGMSEDELEVRTMQTERGEDLGAEDAPQESLLDEEVPVLSANVVRAGADLDEAAWTTRKVTLGKVLGRWFRCKPGERLVDA